MKSVHRRLLPLLVGVVLTPAANAGADLNALAQGFRSPPDSAKPRVWWHWVNGAVSQEGITADLEWMKRVGIGGFQLFDVNLGAPRTVDQPLVFQSPQWLGAVRHAAAEADRLGLEMSMTLSGGWSETGGPWVKPEQAMKKLVWSETRVRGPSTFHGSLPVPPAARGRFQGLPGSPGPFGPPPSADTAAESNPYYADSEVLAFRVPEAEQGEPPPRWSSSAGDFAAAAVTDGDLNTLAQLPMADSGQPSWIQQEFQRPVQIRSLSLTMAGRIPKGEVQTSQDGQHFTTLLALPGPEHNGIAARTYALPASSARFYRIVFTAPPASTDYEIRELQLSAAARINRWEDKAGFATMYDVAADQTPAVPAAFSIPAGEVRNLTRKMNAQHRLTWQVPAGEWVILRMGYSLTGQQNWPASPAATGLEVDKLDRRHVESYLHGYVDPLAKALGPYWGKSLQGFLLDSWEAGLQNWTESILSEFRSRRGYDPRPYLPALTGRVVDNAEVSERFLWDFRRTIADLVADNHYGTAARFAHQRGMKLYAEAPGVNLPAIAEGLGAKGRVDVPMGEFWRLPGANRPSEHIADIREAASASHVYGKKLVAAESFTGASGWNDSPASLKALADFYFAQGVNLCVIHTSAHQPFADRAPGMTLGPFGLHYTRHNTWAEQSLAWNQYLARSSYLLQQGLFVGDIAYLAGEGAPDGVPYWRKTDTVAPAGYDYDYINAEALLRRASVREHRIVLADGMSYALLVLSDPSRRITLRTLRKLRDLVKAGASIAGSKPLGSPSLEGYPASDVEFKTIANELWGEGEGGAGARKVGRGRVYGSGSLAEVLSAERIEPDLRYQASDAQAQIVWTHRRAGVHDLYFISNQKDRATALTVDLRVAGRTPQLWHADSGTITPASYSIAGGRTAVSLNLAPHEAVFVVFAEPSARDAQIIPERHSSLLMTLSDGWRLSLPTSSGSSSATELAALTSWSESSDPKLRYFSGTASYQRDFSVSESAFTANAQFVLDLGEVKELAEVVLNGTSLGVLWKRPFTVDVSRALRPGINHLELRVTNLWVNRLIGDQQLPPEQRSSFTIYQPYNKSSPLAPSGLLGPVTLSVLSEPAADVAADSSKEGICAAYERSEVMIPMRDGTQLYTQIYQPKQRGTSTGILINRTPYLTSDEICPPRFAALFDEVWQDGYILVRQSIRGRGKSTGTFVLAAPLRPHQDLKVTDESTDAWDTVEWLVKNVPGNNGKAAIIGVSYDAMLAVMAATHPHPALVAVSPQASPSDFWTGDDFWRNGAFRLNYGFEYAAQMELSRDQQPFAFDNADTFEWYLQLGSLKNVNSKYFRGGSAFWNDQERHRTYDEYWQSRNLASYMKDVRIPVLLTAGWWDPEDFYGPMQLTKALSLNADASRFHLVVGPWIHGGWTAPRGATGRTLAKLDFGSDTARYWRQEVQRPWLAHWLLGKPDPSLPPALSFRTGVNQWMRYQSWPPKPTRDARSLYLSCDGGIRFEHPRGESCKKSYLSDPANPVPYLPRPIGPIYGGTNFGRGYRSPWPDWQAQDQRFSTHRPDTLLFASAELGEEVVLTGDAELTLHISTTGTDGDFIVKLLDIYPGVMPEKPQLAGYHLMLNHVVVSGRYLRSTSQPEALRPGHVYEIKFRFTGNDHAFLKGHRIAVQVQSSLFPVIARNPQTYTDNPFTVRDSDFRPARIDVVFGPQAANLLSIPRGSDH